MHCLLVRSAILSAIALTTAACSVTADVTGYVGSLDRVYRGTSTGYPDHTGDIEITSATGVRCRGEYVWWSAGGNGNLICDDGKTARIRFSRISISSGYGSGVTGDGEPLQFTFGLSEEQSKRYISLPAARSAKRSGGGSGSGFFIDENGTILTNHHVVKGCSTISIMRPNGIGSGAEIVASDSHNDIALLITPQRGTPHAGFRSSPGLRQGEAVVVFGFPLAKSLADGGNLTTGILSALAGLRNDTRFLQISAPVQPGNSGGPLMDEAGHVIGIVTSKLDAIRTAVATGDIPQNVNFAVNGTMVRTFLDSNGHAYRSVPTHQAARIVDIAAQARDFSVKISCNG